MTILVGAIVINPKTGEPFWCTIDSNREDFFAIRRLDGYKEGVGYFETDQSSDYYISAAASDYPRAHTPEGVVHKGTGNGTCLYVAGACAVRIANGVEERYDSASRWPVNTGVKYSRRESGISSTANRSREASAWWDRAVKIGLATAEEFDNSREEDFDECLESDNDAMTVVERFFNVEGSLEYASVCAHGKTRVGGEVEGNTLPYGNAAERNLIAGISFTPGLWKSRPAPTEQKPTAIKYHTEDLKPPKTWEDFDLAIARAVNVGVFQQYGNPQAAFALWTTICLTNGMTAKDYEQMNARFLDGIDVDERVVMGIDDPRRNPSQRTRRDPFAGVVKSYAPARRKNPSPSQRTKPTTLQIDRAMALAEERRRLGWDKFSRLL